jgi:predicted nucleic acid-binding protein
MIVIDTNVFVAAGFKPGSGAGQVVQAVRDGRVRMPWSDATRQEIESVMTKIPPVSWPAVADLFRAEDRVEGRPGEGDLEWVGDAADRKFAAVARAVGATLVSNDDHLLARRDEASITVLTSGECAERLRCGEAWG